MPKRRSKEALTPTKSKKRRTASSNGRGDVVEKDSAEKPERNQHQSTDSTHTGEENLATNLAGKSPRGTPRVQDWRDNLPRGVTPLPRVIASHSTSLPHSTTKYVSPPKLTRIASSRESSSHVSSKHVSPPVLEKVLPLIKSNHGAGDGEFNTQQRIVREKSPVGSPERDVLRLAEKLANPLCSSPTISTRSSTFSRLSGRVASRNQSDYNTREIVDLREQLACLTARLDRESFGRSDSSGRSMSYDNKQAGDDTPSISSARSAIRAGSLHSTNSTKVGDIVDNNSDNGTACNATSVNNNVSYVQSTDNVAAVTNVSAVAQGRSPGGTHVASTNDDSAKKVESSNIDTDLYKSIPILEKYGKPEESGVPVHKFWETFLGNAFNRRLPDDQKVLIDKEYMLPDNVSFGVAPRVPEIIWSKLMTYERAVDTKLQNIQTASASTLMPILKVIEHVSDKSKEVDRGLVITHLSNALAMMGDVSHKTSVKRRVNIRDTLSTEYKGLCSTKTKSTKCLLGDDFEAELKKVKEISKKDIMSSHHGNFKLSKKSSSQFSADKYKGSDKSSYSKPKSYDYSSRSSNRRYNDRDNSSFKNKQSFRGNKNSSTSYNRRPR